MMRAGGDEMVRTITLLCNRIWETGEWPRDWKNSVFIPIFKKGDAKDCGNYRTIALISHTSKILLKIIHKGMESTVERAAGKSGWLQEGTRNTRSHRKSEVDNGETEGVRSGGTPLFH